MKLAIRRLLRPLLVLAAIVSWSSWHAQQILPGDSGASLPINIPAASAESAIYSGPISVELRDSTRDADVRP